jgi:hypothetical protein
VSGSSIRRSPYTFAHVTVGGGYTTDFFISNTGATGAATELLLTDQAGNPFPVLLIDPSTSATLAMGSSFPVVLASAGTSIFRARPINPSDPVKIELGSSGTVDCSRGWGRLLRLPPALYLTEHGGSLRRLSHQYRHHAGRQ